MGSTRRTSLILTVALAAALAGCGEERSPAVDMTKVKADMQKAQARRARMGYAPPPKTP